MTAWANIFPQRVLDLAALDTGLAAPLRKTLTDLGADVLGKGGIFADYATFTYAGGLLTLDDDRIAWTGDGHRIVLDDVAGGGFASIPYADSGATPYYLGARYAEKPSGALLGFEGTPGFSTWVETSGETYTPSAVADRGSSAGLRFTLTGALPTAMKWSTAGATRPVTVWKVNPATSTSEAVATGTLELDTGEFVVDVDHYFGQLGTPSTTAADYRVLVEGLTIGLADFGTDAAYVDLGVVTSTAHATTGELVLAPVSSWMPLFAAEHDVTTGAHTAITVQSIAGSGGTGNDLDVSGNQVRLVASAATGSAVAAAVASAAGSKARLQDAAATAKVEVAADGSIVLSTSVAAKTIQIGVTGGSGDAALLTLDRDTNAWTAQGGGGWTWSGLIQSGVKADAPFGLRYAYDTGESLPIDCSPGNGGWTYVVSDNTATTAAGGWRKHAEANYVQAVGDNSTGGNGDLYVRPLPELEASGGRPGSVWFVSSLYLDYYEEVIGEFTVTLRKRARATGVESNVLDGVGAAISLSTASSTAGASTLETSFAEIVVLDLATYSYFLAITLDNAYLSQGIRQIILNTLKAAAD